MIEKLNTHYSFTAEPSVYDEEALTALQLAGRTAAKVNEVVDDQNLLRHETGVALDDTTKQMLDYIRETNELLDKYKVEVIPAEVEEQVYRYLNNGEFDKAIELYTASLNARLDVAVSSIIGEGVTSAGDLELRDIRIDYLNNKWSSAGKSVRKQIEILVDYLNDISHYISYPEMAVSDDSSAIDINGDLQVGYGFNKSLNVSEGEIYIINSQYGHSFPDAIFFDTAGNMISYAHTNPDAYVRNNYEKFVVVPEGATQMYVNWASEGSVDMIGIRKVIGHTLNVDKLTAYIEKALEPLDGLNPTYTTLAPDFVDESAVLHILENGDCTVAPLQNPNIDYKVYSYFVSPGQRVRVTAGANFGNLYYFMVESATQSFKGFEQSADTGTIEYKTFNIIIPPGVNTIVIGSYKDAPVLEICEGYTDVKKWSHLKWCCVGDSITEKNERTSKNYHDYIHEKTGISVVNLGVSGSGLMPSDTSIPNYLTKVITNPDKTQDVITIMLSGNDALNATKSLGDVDDTGTETWCGSLNNMLNIIENAYADAVIGIITSPPWVNHMPYQNTIFKQMAVKAKEICKRRSIPFLDLFQCSNLNPNNSLHRTKYYSKDNGNGVHPNEAGHLILSSPVYTFLDSLIGMK